MTTTSMQPRLRKGLSGVYQIRNVLTGDRYVGGTTCLSHRFAQHKYRLRRGLRTNRKLSAAWAEHGDGAFTFEVLLRCDPDRIEMYEQAVIDALAPEYNVSPSASSNLGMKLTAESRRKISEVQKGVRRGPPTDEHRRNISLALTGKVIPPHVRKKISDAHKGKKINIETRRRMSKLSDDQVREIKSRIADGEVQAHIAKRFGVSGAVICNIKQGKSYSWVKSA